MNCPQRDCNKTVLIHCAHTTACIMESWICDGENDCWDNSDELKCPKPVVQTCGPDKFMCSNGHCITAEWRCDNEDDCLDATPGNLSSDEQNCTKHCKSNQFKCANSSVCIPNGWQCDGNPGKLKIFKPIKFVIVTFCYRL